MGWQCGHHLAHPPEIRLEMKLNEYQCVVCGGVFQKIRPEEEALAELKRDFGDVPVEECSMVCDECHQKVQAFMASFN